MWWDSAGCAMGGEIMKGVVYELLIIMLLSILLSHSHFFRSVGFQFSKNPMHIPEAISSEAMLLNIVGFQRDSLSFPSL